MTKKVKKTLTVLLNKNTKILGNSGTIATVQAGYARNYLIPQKIAEIASLTSIEVVQKKQKKFQIENQKQEELLKNLKIKLEANNNFIIQKRVREDGTIFGNITKKEIIDIIEKECNTILEKNMIEIPEMKQIGDYEASIHLNNKINAIVKISLLSQ